MQDAALVLQTSVTKTASFNSTSIDWQYGNSPRPLYAKIRYSAATNASGSNAVTFTIEHSTDNSTWYTHTSGADQVLNLSTTAQVGEVIIPILTRYRYIRLVATFSGAGSTPTITYLAAIQPAFRD